MDATELCRILGGARTTIDDCHGASEWGLRRGAGDLSRTLDPRAAELHCLKTGGVGL